MAASIDGYSEVVELLLQANCDPKWSLSYCHFASTG